MIKFEWDNNKNLINIKGNFIVVVIHTDITKKI